MSDPESMLMSNHGITIKEADSVAQFKTKEVINTESVQSLQALATRLCQSLLIETDHEKEVKLGRGIASVYEFMLLKAFSYLGQSKPDITDKKFLETKGLIELAILGNALPNENIKRMAALGIFQRWLSNFVSESKIKLIEDPSAFVKSLNSAYISGFIVGVHTATIPDTERPMTNFFLTKTDDYRIEYYLPRFTDKFLMSVVPDYGNTTIS